MYFRRVPRMFSVTILKVWKGKQNQICLLNESIDILKGGDWHEKYMP